MSEKKSWGVQGWSAFVQAAGTIVLVGITAYYAIETSKLRSGTDKMVEANKVMAETAIQNVQVSAEMLKAAQESLNEMRVARRESSRPYLSYKVSSVYREGIGRHYFVDLVNDGQTAAQAIALRADNPKATSSLTAHVSLLGPRQSHRIYAIRHQERNEDKAPTGFNVTIEYKDLDGNKYKQEFPIAAGDTNPDSLAALNEHLQQFNFKVADMVRMQETALLREAKREEKEDRRREQESRATYIQR